MAIVRLGVEFGVLDIVVNKPYDVLHRGEVVAHIGYLYVRDCAARRYLLELAFKLELVEGVDVLAHVYVVRVGVVALVGDVLYGAEALFIYAREAVAERFCGGAVESEAYVGLLLPLLAVVAEAVHYFKREGKALFGSVRFASHKFCNFIEAYISERYRGVAAEEIFIYLFTLVEAGYRAVLPMYGRYVGRYAHQRVVAHHKRVEAELQPLFHKVPELLFVAPCEYAYLGKVDGYDALVEAAFELIVAVFILPGGEERAAAHRREYVAFVIFAHLLCRDIVGVEALGRALYRKFGEVVVLAAL